jgi:hypothetical protein
MFCNFVVYSEQPYVSRRAADEPMAPHPVNRTQTVA